jgi:murein DD-endopeptidase MepM/ murein hydrolase activator NlpD
VRVGQKVKAGEVIGLTGRTGRATTEHLHFEVKFRGRCLNPAVLFNHVSKTLQCATLLLTKSGGVPLRRIEAPAPPQPSPVGRECHAA